MAGQRAETSTHGWLSSQFTATMKMPTMTQTEERPKRPHAILFCSLFGVNLRNRKAMLHLARYNPTRYKIWPAAQACANQVVSIKDLVAQEYTPAGPLLVLYF